MAKVVSPKLELRALHTILNAKRDTSSLVLSRISSQYFGYDPHKEIFKKISSLVKRGKSIPSSSVMSEDITLSEEAQTILKKKVPSVASKSVDSLVTNLDKYRKRRLLYRGVKQTIDALQGDSVDEDGNPVDVDRVINKLEKLIGKAKQSGLVHLSHAGVGANTKDNLERILDKDITFIPTGLAGFDSVNGGFFKNSLITVTASSGGGKTALAIQLIMNMYRNGASVCVISMEMDADELWARIYSNLTGIDHDIIKLKRFSTKQANAIRKAKKAFDAIGRKNKNRFTIFVPPYDMTFSEATLQVKHLGYEVVVCDYINLFKPDNYNMNQAQQLGEISRQAKVACGPQQMNNVIIMLAQLNKEDDIKYAGAIRENSTMVWRWRRTDKSRETHVIDIYVDKARNQKEQMSPPLRIKEKFHIMKLEDISEEEAEDLAKKAKKKVGDSFQKVEMMDGLDEDEDDL